MLMADPLFTGHPHSQGTGVSPSCAVWPYTLVSQPLEEHKADEYVRVPGGSLSHVVFMDTQGVVRTRLRRFLGGRTAWW